MSNHSFNDKQITKIRCFFLPAVWSRINDQEAGGEESKKGAPRGHYGNDSDAANGFHYSAQSWGHQDLTDVHLQNYKRLYNNTVFLSVL